MAHIREVGITAADMCAYAWHMETTLDGEQVLSDEGYSAFDEERWAPEPPKSKSRTAFERDRARLIHSSALRRLGAKSQILIAGTDEGGTDFMAVLPPTLHSYPATVFYIYDTL